MFAAHARIVPDIVSNTFRPVQVRTTRPQGRSPRRPQDD
jgi:hypothetical protein